MSKEQIDGATLAVLNCYRNKYYAEGNNTEQGVVANAINDVLPILVELKENGYRKQSEECEKRIFNQREELHRLKKRIDDLIQSRNAWKEKAKRVGKQLYDVLNKQNEYTVKHGTWYHGIESGVVYAKCSACGRKMNDSCYGYAYCSLCGARMDGADTKGEQTDA